MADIPALERLLKEIETIPGVHEAVLVGRSGFHIAGRVPKDVNTETFVAMFAVLLGASVEAADTLKENLESVVIHTERSKVVVVADGPKALFVLHVERDVDVPKLRAKVATYAAKMEELL
jgi:predicted regulator of Ras-like GTPase activity (Roadblock/LC7/MglB family)